MKKTRNKIYYLLAFILIVDGFLVVLKLIKGSSSTAHSFTKISLQMNRALPRIIDDNMRLVSTKAEGKIFTYIYNYISAIDLKDAKQETKKFLCTDKFSLAALNDDAIFIFQYYGNGGGTAVGYQISIKDCK